ncbi:transcriptional regulatory protein LysR family protein [Leptolyngbya sp. NIES-3755]|nr:transcriptional regulatory protein LysR family protein [Leptolyngbya sp. NIES-3755]
MDIYQIRYFLAIVETGGFTKAAERLLVSQPSLSAGIKKLEQELGVILFERGGRRAVLTAAGKFFLTKAQSILNDYHAVLHELKTFKTQPILRLGLLRTIRISPFAQLIAAFRQTYPNSAIELQDGDPAALRERLELGEIDLLVTGLDGIEANGNTLPLFRQRIALAVSNTHPFAQRKSVRWSELDGQPYIDRLHCGLRCSVKQQFEAQGLRQNVVYRADNEDWVIALVAAGLGMTVMAEWRDLPGVTYIAIADWEVERTVGLVWRVGQDNDSIKAFCQFAATHDWC